MKRFDIWQTLRKLRQLQKETTPPTREMAQRLRAVERDIVLPVKGAFIGILCYSFYFTRWFTDPALPRSVAQEVLELFFIIYLVFNVVVGTVIVLGGRLPLVMMQRIIFSSNFLDGLFLAALTVMTGGFDSILYWLFPALIVRNAISLPLAAPQLILNFSAAVCYVVAGILDVAINVQMLEFDETAGSSTNPAEPFLLRVMLLVLLTLCCYGVQVLLEKQRLAAEEGREWAARQQQLQLEGRIAAQIAHQIKNPMSIINNICFTLRRCLTQSQPDPRKAEEQIDIIRQEVSRVDRILTELMGYAQLTEGRVERLQLAEEIDKAIHEVFPPAAGYSVTIEKDIPPYLPPLLMQQAHLKEILVNLLKNAREATDGQGRIRIVVRQPAEEEILITVEDNGPGVPSDRLQRIFEPYFSTKPQGTGLGLAIVRYSAEVYGGRAWAESELGKGSRFHVSLPTRTFMKIQACE